MLLSRVSVSLDGVSDWISDPLSTCGSPPQTTTTVPLNHAPKRERKWVVVRGTTFGVGARNYISGFEGSQAVPAYPSGIGNAYDWWAAL
jgi:hypothetical protein